MGVAIITMTDAADGSGVEVSVSFGPAGLDEESAAHALAGEALMAVTPPEVLASAGVRMEVVGHG